jgi:hypothetical protein
MHFPPGTYTEVFYTFTHLTSGKVVENIDAVSATQDNRSVTFTIATADLQYGMWQLEFKATAGGAVLTTALGYASTGGNTAVPSATVDYTGGDTDEYKVYYE